MANTSDWPGHLRAGAVRFARPTAHFDECRAFYGDHLGLPTLASWRGHEGYDGVVFGLPGSAVQLELTQHAADPRIPEPSTENQAADPRIPEPSTENQLVFYLSGVDAVAAVVARLAGHGHFAVDVDNPYWAARGAVSFADPDGWIAILAPWVFGADPAPAPAGV